jgi:hypothetical protein
MAQFYGLENQSVGGLETSGGNRSVRDERVEILSAEGATQKKITFLDCALKNRGRPKSREIQKESAQEH